jgi:hypothetical protein
VRNGFAFLHRISWDPYNEGEDLIPQAKKYKHEPPGFRKDVTPLVSTPGGLRT